MTSAVDPRAAGPQPHTLYVVAARIALLVYAASFLGGAAYAWKTRGRLPSAHGPEAMERAQELEKRGDLAGALRDYRMVADLDRNNYDHARRIAEISRRAGDRTAEVEQYSRARAIWPWDPAVHRGLGYALLAAGRDREALESFVTAARLAPEDLEAQRGIAETLLELERYQAAAAAFQEALRRAPQDASLHNSLGVTMASWGKPQEAIAHFEVAVRLRPDGPFGANLARARQEAGGAP